MEIYLPKKFQYKRKRNIAYLGSKFSNFKYIYYVIEKMNLDQNAKVLDAFGGGANFSYCLYENRPDLEMTYNELNEDAYNYATHNYDWDEKRELEDFLKSIGWCFKSRNCDIENHSYENNKKIYYKIRDNYKYLNSNAVNHFLIRNSFEKFFKSYEKMSAGHSVAFKYISWNNNILKQNKNAFDYDFNDYDLVYLDPPYFNSKKTPKGYGISTEPFIEELTDKLNNTTSKRVLNYYDEEYFNQNLNYTHRYEFQHVKTVGGNKKITTEIIYTNIGAK